MSPVEILHTGYFATFFSFYGDDSGIIKTLLRACSYHTVVFFLEKMVDDDFFTA